MRAVAFLTAVLLLSSSLMAQDYSGTSPSKVRHGQLSLNGYFKDMPSLSFYRGGEMEWSNILQNRLNFSYRNRQFRLAIELRNRMLSGDMVTDYGPFLEEMLKTDNGLVDASFVPFSNKNVMMHSNFDRFFIDWRSNNWQIRAGRQRINWGLNTVSNPNDLFNTYSFFDVDYEERPGADAIRVQYFTGDLSRIELAIAPQEKSQESVAAVMYAFNTSGYDLQFIAGYYRHKLAVGTGWAGHIKNSGFKGELTVFNGIEDQDSLVLVGAVSVDHLFGNGIYGMVEVLYNGGHKGFDPDLLMLMEPMSADNIFISKYAVTATAMYPISPLFSTSVAGMYMPDISGYYIGPNLSYSLLTNLDVSLLAQYFSLNDADIPEMLAVYAQLKWSF